MNRIIGAFTMSAWVVLVGLLTDCSPERKSNGPTSTVANSNAPVIQSEANRNSLTSDMLKFTISVERREWRIGKPGSTSDLGSAQLHIENSCDRDMEIGGQGTFYLSKRFSKNPRDRFYSSSALPGSSTTTSTPTVEHTSRRTWIKCVKGKQVDLVIELDALKWGRVIGAESPNQVFEEVVTTGSYDLFFTFRAFKSINGETPEFTVFQSNSLEVVIKKAT